MYINITHLLETIYDSKQTNIEFTGFYGLSLLITYLLLAQGSYSRDVIGAVPNQLRSDTGSS